MTIPEGRSILVGEGIRLIPSMSDQYFPLLQGAAQAAHQQPDSMALPATTAILAVATIESYVNELNAIGPPFGSSPTEKEQLQHDFRRLGRDVVAKVRRLRELAANPDGLLEAIIDDLTLLVGLRGLLIHFDPQEEHPRLTRTSFQRLCDRVGIQIPKEDVDWLSLEFLLTPDLADWCVDLTTRVLRSLYGAGYHAPRPRWTPFLRGDVPAT
jgi:hypothetical protein